MRTALVVISVCGLAVAVAAQAPTAPGLAMLAGGAIQLPAVPAAPRRNVIFVLVDDLRFDALGVAGHPWIETPNIDALARRGVRLRNAFVTTALCSPSRASILTGQYAHRHRVVDNNSPIPAGTTFFPEQLQAAGYDTAFIGKWHMGGESDAPQRGFHRWVSFRGQGSYLPTSDGLNVDGTRVPQRGYITDEITDYAIDWLKGRPKDRPFFLYLSHKAVHADFVPASRHAGRYAAKPFTPPTTMADTRANYAGKPMWVRNQRNSWHGVDFPYHSDLDIGEYYRRYAETLLAVDDSVGRIVALLAERKLEDTLVVFMGDNGFAFGEHGLIDKRTAYEASMRVPLVMAGAGLPAGTMVDEVVANIDIAPTILEAAGLTPPAMDGRSFMPLARGERIGWRNALLYEYFWEPNFPQTPAMHAVRGARYKYIRYYGLWDTNELYDLVADPSEARNLINDAAHREVAARMNRQLFDTLEATGGMYIPLAPDRGGIQNLRRRGASGAADFPPEVIAPPRR